MADPPTELHIGLEPCPGVMEKSASRGDHLPGRDIGMLRLYVGIGPVARHQPIRAYRLEGARWLC